MGLTYWRKEEGKVRGKVGDLARESSGTTHLNAAGREVCVAWAMCVARVVRTAGVVERMQEGLGMTKLDMLHHFASYPYTMPALQEALVADVPLPATLVHDPAAMEAHYAAHYRLLCLAVVMLRASTAAATAEDGITNPNADADDLEVNMGDDADTVAAVYGGLAGAGGLAGHGMPLRRTAGSRPRGGKRSFGRLGCESGGTRADETQGSDRELGDLSEADVVRDRAN
ncbi:hypothetical protein B0H14DRAFT_3489690 [Mycena olivaceomarginata]|nr:hypothetical protein B0H14DRAFT_3639944 [Mycena olivaceomarginata]KAJ7801365.1 hypothetical protein B0H14DRAFT_3489690 [Mycena olivaceomarginata]